MKAKIKSGGEMLFSQGFSNNWNDLEDTMIINFADKYTYKSFKQKGRQLLIETMDEEVVIIFPGDIPVLEFESFCKDQLVLKIK
jgi:hypothetical protein